MPILHNIFNRGYICIDLGNQGNIQGGSAGGGYAGELDSGFAGVFFFNYTCIRLGSHWLYAIIKITNIKPIFLIFYQNY